MARTPPCRDVPAAFACFSTSMLRPLDRVQRARLHGGEAPDRAVRPRSAAFEWPCPDLYRLLCRVSRALLLPLLIIQSRNPIEIHVNGANMMGPTRSANM